MADKLIYILNDDTQNYPFYILKLTVEKPNLTIEIQQKSAKLLSKLIRKRYCKTLRTSVIISPLSPLSLEESPKTTYRLVSNKRIL